MPVRKGIIKKQTSSEHPLSEYKSESDQVFDDTPRAFQRLTHLTRSTNGTIFSSQDKTSVSAKTKPSHESSSNAKGSQIKIRAGEKLSDFGARVDQALPIADMVRKSNKKTETYDKFQDKLKRHKKCSTHRMRGSKTPSGNVYSEDVRYSYLDLDAGAQVFDGNTFKVTNHTKRKKSRCAHRTNLEDPWAVLETKRHKSSGLHDVAQAPPELKSLKRIKTSNGSGGVNFRTKISLRRQEELEQVRKSVIQNYRRIMAERRGTVL